MSVMVTTRRSRRSATIAAFESPEEEAEYYDKVWDVWTGLKAYLERECVHLDVLNRLSYDKMCQFVFDVRVRPGILIRYKAREFPNPLLQKMYYWLQVEMRSKFEVELKPGHFMHAVYMHSTHPTYY